MLVLREVCQELCDPGFLFIELLLQTLLETRQQLLSDVLFLLIKFGPELFSQLLALAPVALEFLSHFVESLLRRLVSLQLPTHTLR